MEELLSVLRDFHAKGSWSVVPLNLLLQRSNGLRRKFEIRIKMKLRIIGLNFSVQKVLKNA